MDRKIKAKILRANVRATDSFSLKKSTNTSSVFLQEYEKRRAEISPESSDGDYLVMLLLLQVYIENHFHHYFRFILYDFQDEANYPGWNERSYLKRDSGSKLAKFTLFQKYLQHYGLPFDSSDFAMICKAIDNLNNIRNNIAHGHEVSSTSKGGSTTNSPLKQCLNIDSLRKLEQDVLTIKRAWSRIITMATTDAGTVNDSPFVNASQWQNSEFKFTIKDEWY